MGVFMYVHIHVHAQIVVGYIDSNNLSPSLGKRGGWDSSHLYLPVRKLSSILSQSCRSPLKPVERYSQFQGLVCCIHLY